MKKVYSSLFLLLAIEHPLSTFAFEGKINASITQGGHASSVLYSVGTNCLRVERTETNWPYSRNLVNLQTGDITLLFPHNRSFVRLQAASQNSQHSFPGSPLPGGLPPGAGSQGSTVPGMPAMPMLPLPMDNMELKPSGQTTNLLGYVCASYEIKLHMETMQIWATDQLLPYQAWMQSQPHRFGPRMIEQQWGELLKAKKLFPLLATLRFQNGSERYCFEVKSIRPEQFTDRDGMLFQVPTNYFEARAWQF